MLSRYFLGANSKDGFHSLYGSFPPDRSAILHIIKSGPGTGKSGFMRAVGKRAEGHGLAVQYVLCSGDPDSLDGVYIPALHEAWADGTAPHVLEPEFFGVNGDYVNLGAFCRTPLINADRGNVRELTKAYRSEYKKAYACLSSAASLKNSRVLPQSENNAVKLVNELFSQLPPVEKHFDYVNRVFLSAISCKGIIHLSNSISALCKHIFRLDAFTLQTAADEAIKRGLPLYLGSSPLEPEKADAVVLPLHSVAFVGSDWPTEEAESIENIVFPCSERQETDELANSILDLACRHLASAKALHDELEAVYRPYMDFTALSAFTENELDRIFDGKSNGTDYI